jgi:hypothetical protein
MQDSNSLCLKIQPVFRLSWLKIQHRLQTCAHYALITGAKAIFFETCADYNSIFGAKSTFLATCAINDYFLSAVDQEVTMDALFLK